MGMDKLEEILSIVDRRDRQTALVSYAKSLGLDTSQNRDKMGEINEEKFALLIYDTRKKKKRRQSQNMHIFVWAIGIIAGMTALINLLPKLLVHLYEEETAVQMENERIIQGFDKDGKPMREDGQPVLFKMMNGNYKDYYEDGKVKYVYQYEEGQLLRRKHYDRNGRLLKIDNYSE